MVDKNKVRRILAEILKGDSPFSLQVAVPYRNEIFACHYGRGFTEDEELSYHLQALRQFCSEAATPVTLAMVPELEEACRQLEHLLANKANLSRRAAHA